MEIATLVTDDDLDVVAEGPDLVVRATEDELAAMDDFVRDMHTASGLLEEIRTSELTLRRPADRRWSSSGPTCRSPAPSRWPATPSAPTAASWPPTCPRSRSTSTTGRSTSPPSRSWPAGGTPRPAARRPPRPGGHRAMDDIKESVAELAYYRTTVFRDPTP